MAPQPEIRKTEARSYQCEAYEAAMRHRGFLLDFDMGCTDCETEFLSPSGWVRMDQWNGHRVTQFFPAENRCEFVDPDRYICEPCDEEMVSFRSDEVDQVLTLDHKFLLYGSVKEMVCEESRASEVRDVFAIPVEHLLQVGASSLEEKWIYSGLPSWHNGQFYVNERRQCEKVFFSLSDVEMSREPSSDGKKYCFTVPSGYLILRRNGKVFTTGNCGKSKVAIDLSANRKSEKILILCPLSVVGVWPREFGIHYPGDANIVALNKGDAKRKTRLAKEAMDQHRPGRPAVIVIGYESAQSKAFASWSLSQRWDSVILDESHRAKGSQSKTGRHVYRLGQQAKWKLGLTGTPMPHSPLDLWSQFRFLNQNIFGLSYVRFRNRYAVTSEMFKSQVLSWKNQDELSEKYRSLSYRVEASDVLDLPPLNHLNIPCELSAKARRAYRDLEKEMIADLGEAGFTDLIGRAIAGEVVVDNALTKLLRLQQMTCGFIPTEEGKIVDVDDSKQRALRDLLEDLGEKEPVVVFTTFVHSLAAIRTVAEKLGRRYGEISGRRKDLTDHAQMPDNIDVMGVQWQSGSTGIDLTRSAVGVIYSPTFNGGDFDQGLARQYRPGQNRPMRFFHLVATNTCDERVYKSLERRRKLVGKIMEGNR